MTVAVVDFKKLTLSKILMHCHIYCNKNLF